VRTLFALFLPNRLQLIRKKVFSKYGNDIKSSKQLTDIIEYTFFSVYFYYYYYYMIYIAPISRIESEALASLGGEHDTGEGEKVGF